MNSTLRVERSTPIRRSRELSHNARVLILGTACIAIILGTGKGVPIWLHWRADTAHELDGAQARLTRDQRLVASRRAVRASLDHQTTLFLGLSQAFLKGKSASQGAASLASILADAGDANGVHLSSLQPEADSTSRSLIVPVMVRASGTGDIRGIAGMLRDLEAGVPLIEIRELTVGQSDPAAPADRMEALHVELTIRGLYRRTPGDSD